MSLSYYTGDIRFCRESFCCFFDRTGDRSGILTVFNNLVAKM